MERNPVAERRSRQREQILRATARLAAEVGWQQVTMRRLASALGCQPPSIYEYFSGKEEILSSLVRNGFRRLLERLDADGAEPSLRTIATTVWAFAWEEPEVYQAMHGLGGMPFGWDVGQAEAKALFAIGRRAVEREVGEGARLDLDAATDTCWALLHGTISLAMSGRIAGGPERAARLLESGLAALTAGWREAGR